MPFRSNIRPGLVLVLLGLTGCAAPIKALMGEPVPLVDQAAIKAADEEEVRLRAALQQKGQALLRARTPQAEHEPSVAKVALGATSAPRGPAPAVSAMLARARIAKAPRPDFPAEVTPRPDLTRNIRVKDETRFQASPLARPSGSRIRS